MQHVEINVKNFYIVVAPTIEHPLIAEYLPDSHEAVLHTPYLEPLEVQMHDGNTLCLALEHIELHLSDDCIRQLFEKLPPELVH